MKLFYIDCNGDPVELEIMYRLVGPMYYTSEILLKLVNWQLALIFLVTSITFETTLETQAIIIIEGSDMCATDDRGN